MVPIISVILPKISIDMPTAKNVKTLAKASKSEKNVKEGVRASTKKAKKTNYPARPGLFSPQRCLKRKPINLVVLACSHLSIIDEETP